MRVISCVLCCLVSSESRHWKAFKAFFLMRPLCLPAAKLVEDMGPGVASDTVEGLGAPLTADIVAVWWRWVGAQTVRGTPAVLAHALPRSAASAAGFNSLGLSVQIMLACTMSFTHNDPSRPGPRCWTTLQNLGPDTVEEIVRNLGPQYTGEYGPGCAKRA